MVLSYIASIFVFTSLLSFFDHFLVQVKIEVTGGQKDNFERNVFFFDDNVFDLNDRATILVASCLTLQGTWNHVYDIKRSKSKFDLRSR